MGPAPARAPGRDRRGASRHCLGDLALLRLQLLPGRQERALRGRAGSFCRRVCRLHQSGHWYASALTVSTKRKLRVCILARLIAHLPHIPGAQPSDYEGHAASNPLDDKASDVSTDSELILHDESSDSDEDDAESGRKGKDGMKKGRRGKKPAKDVAEAKYSSKQHDTLQNASDEKIPEARAAAFRRASPAKVQLAR